MYKHIFKMYKSKCINKTVNHLEQNTGEHVYTQGLFPQHSVGERKPEKKNW